jgi:predicted lipoprotein
LTSQLTLFYGLFKRYMNMLNGYKIQKSLFLAISLFALTACGGSSGSSTTNNEKDNEASGGNKVSELSEIPGSICTGVKSAEFNCAAMLTSVLNNAVIPTVDDLAVKLTALDTEVTQYCASIDQAEEASQLSSAQSLWKQTMTVWQQLEVMQFGKIAEQRDNFYSWPLNDECKVDVDVVLGQADDYDITNRTAPRRGLDALEYLLFDNDIINDKLHVRCQTVGAGKITNVPGLLEWDDLTLVEQKTQRCKQSNNITRHLITRAEMLKQSITTGVFDESINTYQDAADSISDALFYIDKNTKDVKANKALPASPSGSFNTGHLESQYAQVSLSNIQNNLLGAKLLMTANDNLGFHDFLVAAGQEDLANVMVSNLDLAIAASSEGEITEPLMSIIGTASLEQRESCINAVAGDASLLGKVCALGTPVVQAFTSDLKDQFVLTLNFTVPSNAEGDND